MGERVIERQPLEKTPVPSEEVDKEVDKQLTKKVAKRGEKKQLTKKKLIIRGGK